MGGRPVGADVLFYVVSLDEFYEPFPEYEPYTHRGQGGKNDAKRYIPKDVKKAKSVGQVQK
jgi:hypothetical protein